MFTFIGIADIFGFVYTFLWGLPWWLSGKNLPTMQETWVRPLGWEDPLE